MNFIRSVQQISFYTGAGSGIIMTESEVIDWFGEDGLLKIKKEIEDKGSVILSYFPGLKIKETRENQNLDICLLEEMSKVSLSTLLSIEASDRNVSVWIYDHVARTLGLHPKELYSK